MNVTFALQLALLGIGLLLFGLTIAISIERTSRDRLTAKTARRHALLRPLLLELLADDDVDWARLESIANLDRIVFEQLAWSMLPKLRGASRDVLVEWLDENGAVSHQQQLTYSRSPVKRAKAAEKLGCAGIARTSRDVVRLLDDSHADVRIVAARAAGKSGDPSAVPALFASLDSNRSIPFGTVFMAVLHLGPSVVPELMAGLAAGSSSVRRVCADLLGMHGVMSATVQLGELLALDVDETVRTSAATALGRIGAPQSLQSLSDALESGNPHLVRAAATRALGHVGGRHAVETLKSALADVDLVLAEFAAQSLAGLGSAGHDVLQVVASGDGESSVSAAHWLARQEIESSSRRQRLVTAR
jgi:HEAT repeat protein